MDVRTSIPTNYGESLARFQETWKKQIDALKSEFGKSIEEVRMPGDAATDVPIIFVSKHQIVEVLKYAKTQLDYSFLSDLTCTDEQPEEKRFEVVYNLFSHSKFCRIRFKVRLKEDETIPTVIEVWAGANWAEREVFDMYGVRFEGHPDLRRILMDERWEGHPLRKDYPLKGYQLFPTPEPINPKLLD